MLIQPASHVRSVMHAWTITAYAALQGLVKLADFGVAAKLGELEEANNSLRLSVVGTPYWMAPEVIEMTSVTAAADIWSVACLSIELLTGQAPYYDLQPMSALFRIVQDEHPPLPEDISPGMHNMLLQCFNKDPQKRPDARTLLRHPWIQHNRQTLRSSWSRTQGLHDYISVYLHLDMLQVAPYWTLPQRCLYLIACLTNIAC